VSLCGGGGGAHTHTHTQLYMSQSINHTLFHACDYQLIN
jgi:hypothetical protein